MYEPQAVCTCGHTQRQHRTRGNYCGYCDCEAFNRDLVKNPIPTQPPPPQQPAPAAPAPTPLAAPTKKKLPSIGMSPERDQELRDKITRGVIAPAEALQYYMEAVDALQAELARIRAEGTPGVLHKTDKDYARILAAERDAEKHAADRARAELKAVKAEDERFLLHLVDVVWGDAMEDGQVPATDHARMLIEKARETLDEQAQED